MSKMTTKEFCLLLARRYRKRSRSVSWANGECRGICSRLLDGWRKKEISYRQKRTIDKYVSNLPYFGFTSYKFPTDNTGFLLRAKWLEQLSKKFR